jgi:hypothetical protein
MGKWLVFLGLAIALLGLLFWLGEKVQLPFGKLPGDIEVQKEKFTFYAPLVTSLVLSVFLTLLINLIFWLFRR